MVINEDEEEDDEEQEIKNNNVSPYGPQSGPTSDSDADVGDDALKGFLNGINGYHDEQSQTTSTTIDGFDYSYDAEVVVKEDADDELVETGSVQFHSDVGIGTHH